MLLHGTGLGAGEGLAVPTSFQNYLIRPGASLTDVGVGVLARGVLRLGSWYGVKINWVMFAAAAS